MNEQETIQEKAILVGCQLPHITDEHFENSMEELGYVQAENIGANPAEFININTRD
ncbi:hypothetical protein ACWGM3_19490, partial [Bacillus subtilis]